MMNEVVNVLIADGRKLFREGLCLVLERQPGIRVVGEAEELRDVPRLTKALCVDLVILNLTQQTPDWDQPGFGLHPDLRAVERYEKGF